MLNLKSLIIGHKTLYCILYFVYLLGELEAIWDLSIENSFLSINLQMLFTDAQGFQ